MLNVASVLPCLAAALPAPSIPKAGRPPSFSTTEVNRLLGRCGRVADTSDPDRYVIVFRKLSDRFGRRLRYGFMVPINLVLYGVVHHPLYANKRLPQLAPLVLFKQEDDAWTARAVVSIRQSIADLRSELPLVEEELTSLYADFGVEHLVLRPELVEGDYLHSPDFKRRVSRAVYAPCALPPQPLPTPRRARLDAVA